MGWEASQGAVDKMENVNVINWTVESVTHWDIKPICFINTDEQYEVPLNITVYSEFVFKYYLLLLNIIF